MNIKKILLLLAIVSVTVMSCTNVQEEIVGTWTYQTFDDSPQGTMTWSFQEDGTLIRVLQTDTGILFDSCTYTVDKSLLKTRISVSGSEMLPSFDAINGVFRIDKFKADILSLTRITLADDESAGAYLRCEMIRKL